MGHLQSSMEAMASNDPNIEKIVKIGVGSHVVYVGREGSSRQGRTEFPALVLKQHPDDGTLDLLVIYEPEDMLWEQRVAAWRENLPGRSWKPVKDEPTSELSDAPVGEEIDSLRQKIFGEFNEPEKSVMEYLDDFDQRLSSLERQLKKGK